MLLTSAFAAVLILSVSPMCGHAQVLLKIDRKVKVHAGPALKSARINGLTPSDTATLIPGHRRGSFFKVRFQNDKTVVEIPAADLSPGFNKARNELISLLGMTEVKDKDFPSPTRVRVTGLAFWDGWHATSNLPVKHGRCNSTKGAAWELHPVFKASAP